MRTKSFGHNILTAAHPHRDHQARVDAIVRAAKADLAKTLEWKRRLAAVAARGIDEPDTLSLEEIEMMCRAYLAMP